MKQGKPQITFKEAARPTADFSAPNYETMESHL